MAVDGIVGANYMISQLGRSYSEMDCIRAAVVNVIRNCPGGDPSYRTAGCTELWNSYEKSGKYHHVVERMTLAEAKSRGMLIGDLPVIYDARTGECEHIAYYMGGIGGYECIHSSATKGCVCGTTLKNGFTHVLRHRDITGRTADGSTSQPTPSMPTYPSDGGNETMNILYNVNVVTAGGHLNLRSAPSTTSAVICEIANGTILGVVEETNKNWYKVVYGNSVYGYVSTQYIVKQVSPTPTPEPDTDQNESGSETWCVVLPCHTADEANRLREILNLAFTKQISGID